MAYNFIIISHNSPSGYRRLSPEECELLMTFPKNYTKMGNNKIMSDSARYKSLGNSWTCDIIVHIFKEMLKENNE